MASLPCSAPATLALHPQQLAFGSFTAGPPDVHQAAPVSFLASPFGFSGFARRRTRQQALPRVPAGECEIVAKTRLVLQVRATAGHGLTIRSSRVRFAASAQCGNLLHHAKAAHRPGLAQALALRNSWSCSRSSVTSGSRVGPRELSRLRLTSGFGDQSAHFRGNRSEEQVVGPSTTCSPQMQSTKITALTTRSSRRRFVASPVCVRYARTRRRTVHGAA